MLVSHGPDLRVVMGMAQTMKLARSLLKQLQEDGDCTVCSADQAATR